LLKIDCTTTIFWQFPSTAGIDGNPECSDNSINGEFTGSDMVKMGGITRE